ncbi:holin family protein [Salmonella enterica subsp. enterica serovar Montevideo]|nr:holin family protein [Salmonella enterica subsp. enterica serovar Montevideo]
MTLERISAFITYCIAVLLAWLGDLSLKDASTVGGVLIGVLMLAINWYYKHQSFNCYVAARFRGGNMNPSIVKRCLSGRCWLSPPRCPDFSRFIPPLRG